MLCTQVFGGDNGWNASFQTECRVKRIAWFSPGDDVRDRSCVMHRLGMTAT